MRRSSDGATEAAGPGGGSTKKSDVWGSFYGGGGPKFGPEIAKAILRGPGGQQGAEDPFTLQYAEPAAPAASAPRPKAKGKKSSRRSELDSLLEQGYRYIPEPNTAVVSVQVMPERTSSTHIELKTADPIAGLVLSETRGREPTMVERLRSKVQ